MSMTGIIIDKMKPFLALDRNVQQQQEKRGLIGLFFLFLTSFQYKV